MQRVDEDVEGSVKVSTRRIWCLYSRLFRRGGRPKLTTRIAIFERSERALPVGVESRNFQGW